MALGIRLIEATDDSIEVEATGFSSSVAILNWYIDNVYDGSCSRGDRDWPTWLFTGLDPDTRYTIKVAFFDANNTKLDTVSKNFQTEPFQPVAETYYAKVVLNGNGGTTSGGDATITFTEPGWMSSWDGYADVPVDYDGSYFDRPGYKLAGFSESRSTSHASYPIADRAYVYSTSTSQSRPAKLTLYAVWDSGRPDDWYWNPSITQGGLLSITASHWNSFIARIEEFADYKGVGLSSTAISNARASKGGRMMASQAQAAVTLIKRLSPPQAPPAPPSPGDIITASFMNGLKNSLNSIR